MCLCPKQQQQQQIFSFCTRVSLAVEKKEERRWRGILAVSLEKPCVATELRDFDLKPRTLTPTVIKRL